MSNWKSWNGDKVVEAMRRANSRAIYATLQEIGSKSDQQVPLDESTLLKSKHIDVQGNSGVISYGGGPGTGHPKVPYAKRWHENSANFQHGRKKRYLADPFNKNANRLYKKALKQQLTSEW